MNAWQITKKDLKLMFRDRRALATLVVFPLVFITIIGLTTGQLLGWKDRNKQLKIAVVDQIDYSQMDDENSTELSENPKLARNLVVKFLNRIQKRDGIHVQEENDPAVARKLYKNGTVNTALLIGPAFIERVDALNLEDILVPDEGRLSDGLKSLDIVLESVNPGTSTHSLVDQFVFGDAYRTIYLNPVCKDAFGQRRIRSTCEELKKEAAQPPVKLLPPQESEFASGNDVYQELIPGFTVMFVFFLVNIMARSFIHERQLGTLRRLRIAPLRPAALLAGKTVPFFAVSLIQTMLLFSCGRVLFGMEWGPEPWALLPVIFCTSMAATALGLLVATVARTDSQVAAYGNFIVITLAGISGCFMPREWLPEEMKQVSLYTPHAWALIAFDQLLTIDKKPDLSIVYKSCGMLSGFAVLFFGFGCVRFGKVD